MRSKATAWTAVLIVVVAAPTASAAPAADDVPVRVYLPRNVEIDADGLTLGVVAIVRCADENLESKARAVPMGRAPWPREKLVFDRTMILSRLAGSEIAKQRVRLSGSQTVTVVREEKVVDAEELLAAAQRFLETRRTEATKDCVYKVLRRPGELVVSGRRELEIACKPGRAASPKQVTVVVTVRHGGRQVGLREVTFLRLYAVRQAVAVKTIPAGVSLTKENVEVRTDYADHAAPADWKPPYGLLARRRLMPGMVIRASLVAEKKPDLVIRRNQMVPMRVQGPGFVIRAVGQALQEGRPGDFIRVRNIDSRRLVTARVAFDGSVEPTFKR